MRSIAITRRRRGMRLGRGTRGLGALALTAGVATVAVEARRMWDRSEAPIPHDAQELLATAGTVTRETVAVLREGYRASPDPENAVFNLFAAFAATFACARATTLVIRSGRGRRVARNLVIGNHHIHHFVPGMLLALAAGGVSISVRSQRLDRWLALPFGAGAALVLDEAALLLELEDVYWSEEGVLSLQLSFATAALLASGALAVRLLRRGEPIALPGA